MNKKLYKNEIDENGKTVRSRDALGEISSRSNHIKARLKFKYLIHEIERAFYKSR